MSSYITPLTFIKAFERFVESNKKNLSIDYENTQNTMRSFIGEPDASYGNSPLGLHLERLFHQYSFYRPAEAGSLSVYRRRSGLQMVKDLSYQTARKWLPINQPIYTDMAIKVSDDLTQVHDTLTTLTHLNAGIKVLIARISGNDGPQSWDFHQRLTKNAAAIIAKANSHRGENPATAYVVITTYLLWEIDILCSSSIIWVRDVALNKFKYRERIRIMVNARSEEWKRANEAMLREMYPDLDSAA